MNQGYHILSLFHTEKRGLSNNQKGKRNIFSKEEIYFNKNNNGYA